MGWPVRLEDSTHPTCLFSTEPSAPFDLDDYLPHFTWVISHFRTSDFC